VEQDTQSGHGERPGLAAAWVSDVGRVREKNEDRLLVSLDDGLFVVSDGMGGKPAGERAAGLVVQWLPELLAELQEVLADPTPREMEVLISDAVLKLNRRVRREGRKITQMGTMGATLAMALARQAYFHVAHMGDSRVYLFEGRRLHQLTHDHTPIDVLIRRGAITLEQAKHHPMRGVLSRYIGMRSDPEVDVTTISWERGDRMLLCSDGLTEVVTDNHIEGIFGRQAGLLQTCQDLVKAAINTGSRDNITVVMAENTG